MDCSQLRAEGMAERYLLGRLDAPDQEAFEDHLVACAECSEELAALSALRDELERSRERIVAEAAASSRPSRRTWVLAAAAAAAVLAAGLGLWMRLQPSPPPEAVLAELAVFEPPGYAPVVLRGVEDDADRQLFSAAMERYVAGDYASAVTGLEQAAALEPDAPDVSFYLGASYLLTGRTEQGVAALEHTVELGETPYFEDALLLLAKAHLGRGDLRNARTALERLIERTGEVPDQARAMINVLDGGTRGKD